MYKLEGLSKTAGQFIAQNTDLPTSTDDGITIYIVEIDRWLHLMLDVGENVSYPVTAIRNAAPLVIKWKDRLLDFQGVWRGDGENAFLARLSNMHKHKKSYQRLAELINQTVENYLREYLAYREEIDSRYPLYKKELDSNLYFHAFATEFQHSGLGLTQSRDLLMAIGLSNKEIDRKLRDGLKRLREGKKPFGPGRPVSKAKLGRVLNKWQESNKPKQSEE